MRLHAVAISKNIVREIDKVHAHFDTLFFDAQRRDLQKSARLHQRDLSEERDVSAPLLDRDVDTHCDIHSITGKQLDLYFEVIGDPPLP